MQIKILPAEPFIILQHICSKFFHKLQVKLIARCPVKRKNGQHSTPVGIVPVRIRIAGKGVAFWNHQFAQQGHLLTGPGHDSSPVAIIVP